MSATGQLRALAFGTVDGSLWGAAIDHGHAALVLGDGGRAEGLAEGLTLTPADDGTWRLLGAGVALTATPTESPGEGPQPCRVQGSVADREVDCAGTVIAVVTSGGRATPGSARLVAAWFDDTAALALLAVRPKRSEHQDGDVSTAALFDPEECLAVSDPRLSTTYDDAGSPTRTNLELWVGEGDDEFPRRAAGEAAGAGARAVVSGGDGVALSVVPMRCHSRGHDGAGVYAVATL